MPAIYQRKACGFTLLEVLIALIVLSIGLIGMAGLIVQGQKFNRYALNRSQASFLAYDMADRIRANTDGAPAYDVDTTPDPERKTACTDTENGCSSTDMAENDLFEWNRQISGAPANGNIPAVVGALPPLPNGDPATGSVEINTVGTSITAEISVVWGEAEPNVGLVIKRYDLVVQL